ncbi:pyridoxine biosynthesis protein [Emydomyces testavorans]|uniref:Pyridoxine biosynthesis protein n=1 Tax=Emydomyces testavorans TaxID=2070801 RepID=A0AAF0DJP7_9EURO|nr:pyridoxine biosynthesis protein [Emydomyces testavorans]
MAGHSPAARLSRCIPRQLGNIFRSSAVTSSQQTKPLYPSVAQLVHENNIPEADISKIPATGPNGRLLKGDVLSYIGAIPSDYPSTLSSRLSKLAQLDLSNIKPAAAPQPTKQPAQQHKPTEAAVDPEPIPAEEEDLEAKLAVPISLSRVLRVQKRVRAAIGVTIPLETFVAKATEIANDELPVTRSRTRQEIADQLFDEIVGAQSSSAYDLPPTSRGDYVADIISPAELDSVTEQSNVRTADIIDILSGNAPVSDTSRQRRMAASPVEDDQKTSVFSVTVPTSETLRGQAFLERMQTVLEDEPEKLVVL